MKETEEHMKEIEREKQESRKNGRGIQSKQTERRSGGKITL